MIDPLISDHSEIYRAVLAALVQVSRRAGVSSAHLLFSRLPQVASLFSDEFQLRIDLQYHWYNRDYQDMDAFLSEFSSSKRKAIRKERRSVKETGVEIRNLRGHELGEKEIDSLFCFYLATKEKYPWGRAYLNRDFIAYLVKNTPESILATFAYQNGSENPIAGALSYLDKERLYGRYWGSTVEIPYLHFEVCYYAPIEFAIANGLRVFEPGAGGEHKLSRGFLPQLTASRHWIGDQRLAHAIKNFLTQERRAVVNYAESLSLPFSEISTGLESYRKSFQDDLILLGLR